MSHRRSRARRSREGLTLLELAVLLSVIGVVLAAFLPTFMREVRLSKVSEASENLADLHRRAAAYYAERHPVEGSGLRGECIVQPAGPAPAQASEEAREVDFAGPQTPGHASWQALGFQPRQPVRFRYTLTSETEPGCGPRDEGDVVELRFIAEGDLDADGVLSRFERRARNEGSTDELVPVGPLRVQRRVE